MNTLPELLNWVVSTMQRSPCCRSVQVVEIQQFSIEQFAVKVRAELINAQTLQVRLYHNGDHFDYAYHLIRGDQSIRWDNKEHFPSLPSFPHHLHDASGRVEISPLSGDPTHDLPVVLDQVSNP